MAIGGTIRRTVDLDKGVTCDHFERLFATSDDEAHVFEITVTASGKPVDLTGAGVSGYFIRKDKQTVVLTGSAASNVATLALKTSCYVEPGYFSFVLKASSGCKPVAIYWADGNVTRASTDAIIDPGHEIPSLEELLAHIAEIDAAVEAATSAAKTANDAAGSATTAAGTANTAASAANTAAGKANDAATAATTAKTNADKATTEANAAANLIKNMTATVTKVPEGGDPTVALTKATDPDRYNLALGLVTGDTGKTGATGPAAGFGTITATVDDNVGTPSVDVTASGPDTAKNLKLDFHNLKGIPGEGAVDSVWGAQPDDSGDAKPKVGGTQILRGTNPVIINNPNGWPSHSWDISRATQDYTKAEVITLDNPPVPYITSGVRINTPDGLKSYNGITQLNIPAMPTGETFTLSCWARITEGGGAISIQFDINTATDFIHINSRYNLSKEWKRYFYTITLPENTKTGASFHLVNQIGETTIEICGMKLEAGNVPTDWSPAPEDLEAASGNVYSPSNPPPYPVSSVNGETGAIKVKAIKSSVSTGEAIVSDNSSWAGLHLRNFEGNSVFNQIYLGVLTQNIYNLFFRCIGDDSNDTGSCRIYHEKNAPPYPVSSVNGETGAVTVKRMYLNDTFVAPHDSDGWKGIVVIDGTTQGVQIGVRSDGSPFLRNTASSMPESQNIYTSKFAPPYPVSSVNGRTGAVSLTAANVGALPSTTKVPTFSLQGSVLYITYQ